MNDLQQRIAAKKFAECWKGKGYEKGQGQPFWMSLLRNVFGIENVENFIKFEDKVMLDNTSFIDGIIDSTHVLIEQKGLGKDLKKPIKQSDGSTLTPLQQAKRYAAELPYSQRPRWIVTCNFSTFLVYDMEAPSMQPEEILLENLPKEYYRLSFLVDTENEHIKREKEISIKAGELVGILYDEFLKQYIDPTSEYSLKSLNMLCVRLVFCLYAEDAGIFGRKNMFHDYLSGFDVRNMRRALIDLFEVLDIKEEEMDPYMDSRLAEFPYVNGGLFSSDNIEIPQFTDEIRKILLSKASDDFDWSEISPTIFGAVFESTLNPETRRTGGMHYTSIENIHKVIDPLFLNELRGELNKIKALQTIKSREENLKKFQLKLSSLKFLDPACGSGNFLTETYISLRRLENEVLECLHTGQIFLGDDKAFNPIKVSIKQFYGLEINDFAVTVAKTALWIAESQMMKETEEIVHMNLEFLPLKSYPNIAEENALNIDWESVVSKYELNFIMGNPPFVGARLMTKSQKDDMLRIFGKLKGVGNLDYVSAWYKKASDYIENTKINAAFVSTNSITQGEQPSILWKSIMEKGISIDFAYRTFKWNSEASEKAAVHCVIVGFSKSTEQKLKYIFHSDKNIKQAKNINAYLIDAPNIFIESRNKPLFNVPEIVFGSMPNDNGFLSNYTDENKNEITKKYPEAKPLFRKIMGAHEFINNKSRWCLWLKGASPELIKNIPPVFEAVQNVHKTRKESNREATRKLADIPTLFGEIRQPETKYLLIPSVSSENRRYIPMDFMTPDIITNNSCSIIPDATLYHFGILISNVHMAWMRAIAGRLKSDYRYSGNIVYNNFPFITPTEEQKRNVENTAQAILDARAMHENVSFANLYDEVLMPAELRKAHQQNDKAVMEIYGLPIKNTTEESCLSELMKLYLKKISE